MKTKTPILWSVVLLTNCVISLQASAEIYWKDGLKWTENTSKSGIILSEDNYYHTLKVDPERNNPAYLREYVSKSPDSLGEAYHLARVEGNKVYLVDDRIPNGEALLYDFGMSPGDHCSIINMLYFNEEQDFRLEMLELTCLDIAIDEYWGIEVMYMSPSCYDDNHLNLHGVYKNEWFPGIGNYYGLFEDSQCDLIGRWRHIITEISYNGTTLYEHPSSGMTAVMDLENVKTEYFTLQGIRLPQPPDKGIFLMKRGNNITKVAAAGL